MGDADAPVTYRSAGGIVVDPTGDLVLLLIRPSRDEVRLPKGHIEEGESLEETALRETQEEAGYGDLEVITGSESGIDVFYRLTDPVGFKKDLLNQEAMASSAGQAGSARPSAVEMIADLDRLRKSGVITDAEFKTKKRELLDSI